MTRIAVLAIAALLALAACTTNPATGRRDFTGLISPAEEQRIGAEQHPKLVQQFGGAYSDASLDAYVQSVGERVAQATEVPDTTFSFTVLNDGSVNAFALPGGYVHVTRGLLALASNEAELAGVLAHEIGHVVARHSTERYNRAVAANIGATVLAALGEAAGVPVEDVAVLGAQAYLQAYSRDQEFEADTLGVRYMARAGYDPAAMSTFLAKLSMQARIDAAESGDPEAANRIDIFASHPRTAERVLQAARAAGAADTAGGTVGRSEYLEQIDGLIYGDDPSQGVRMGSEFLHPDLGIAFSVPPGFSMLNTPRNVIARGPQGSLLVFDMASVAEARAAPDLPTYVAQDWGGRLALKGVERIDVGGMEGATGANRVRTETGVVDVRLVAIRERPGRIYRFLYLTPPGVSRDLTPALRKSTYSFRRLTDAEAAAIRPLRIEVVTAEPGDTIESLAARMPFETFRIERFLALNDVDPGTPLEPGQTVKIVTR